MYEAIITLRPPEAEGKLSITVTLYDDDVIETQGQTKQLGECTLEELGVYADELEAQLGQLYREITLAELVAQPDFDVAISEGDEDWLEQIVVFGQADDSAEVEIVTDEVEPEVVEATVAEPAPTVAIVEDDEVVEVADAVIETVTEQPATPTKVTVSQSEPIHEERETDVPTETEEVANSTPVLTAGQVYGGVYHANAVDILIDEPPLRMMQEHAKSSMRREVAGVMVGPIPEKQPAGHYVVHVTDMIIAKHTRMSGASVTYTPESWRYMNDQLAAMYPHGDHVMVGWYHTHPGFGIFLSNMDLFIHMNFFTQKWHIAYVLDPVAERSGFFSWNRPRNEVMRYNFPWPKWAPYSW